MRARIAGIPAEHIMLTTQEVSEGGDMETLQDLILRGLKYNVCSLRQLRLIGDFAAERGIALGIRVHPGVGSGESVTRNTGDDYSCFGVHLRDVETALEYAAAKGIKFRHVHEHIGSGGDPDVWRRNIDRELGILERHFPDAETVSFGGGLKEARMPGERAADIADLGRYAKERIEDFYARTGRKLKVEIEPGTYITANAGYAITRVIDKKSTGHLDFIIADGGMELNARPLMYGSKHPFYIVSNDGALKSSEFDGKTHGHSIVVAGRCCENSDMQTLTPDGYADPRAMAEPEIGDLCVIGGTGAYCSSMAPFNYNSHPQIPELLLTEAGEPELIRKRQTLTQILENEI
jgi:diaminopimelate decarboxylase